MVTPAATTHACATGCLSASAPATHPSLLHAPSDPLPLCPSVPSSFPRFDPDTLPVETFDRTTALRSDQWPESPTASMPPDFTPSPEAESILLQQLASPESSLTYLARVNGTTVDALSLWMARPDIMKSAAPSSPPA